MANVSLQSQNACGCTVCPTPIPDNDTIISVININGALNNDLASASQGVCRVCIKFKHDFVSDLQMRLISPSGQSITLLAPISQQGFTAFSQWNVCFVPCNNVASPDPGYPAQWSNGGWGSFGNYKGSYYPFNGCLEDFNLGAVNGAWRLMVIDGDGLQVGTILDWTIEFCDPNGLDCIRCDAKSGSLSSYPSVTACKGDASLNLKVPPIYTPASAAPSAAYYAYSYVISENDVIKRIQPTADLRGLAAGNYTVCGMSYRISDGAKIPVPNGTLTLTQLKNQINALNPAYCARLTTSCIPVLILPTTTVNLDKTVCNCYELNNIKYCQSGFYQQKIKSSAGCDSIVNLNLTIVPTKSAVYSATTCKGVPFMLGTKKLNFSGTYKDTTISKITGCDSITTINLLVRDPNRNNYTLKICEGDSVLQAGKYYKTEGIYEDVVKTSTGCDSVLILDLQFKTGGVKNIDTIRCAGESVIIEGKVYDKTGKYRIKLNTKANNGCDSILNLNLKIYPIFKDTLRKQICQGDTVKVGKSKYFQTGAYFDILKSSTKCDSLVWSIIEVKTTILINLKKEICQGETFRFNGKDYTTSTLTSVTNQSKNGCDSTTNLNLIVRPKPNIKRNYTVCYGDTLIIGKNAYFKTGVYRDTLKTQFGCDSLHEATVVALPKLETYLTQKLCEPATVVIGNHTYIKSGVYLDTLQNINGCDSIIRLDLKIYPQKDTILKLNYCFGDNPVEFPNSGNYIKKLKTAFGCDSTVTFNVKIYPKLETIINAQICTGSSYIIGNQVFTTQGQHIIKDTSRVTGCDSTIVLNLILTTQIKVIINEKICEGDSIVIGNKVFKNSISDTIQLKSFAGCDSLVTLNLIVNPRHFISIENTICDGDFVKIGAIKYYKAGLYKIDTINRFGCDSLVTIIIKVKKRPVTEFTEKICEGDFYQLGKKKIYISGFHQDTLLATNGCDSILSLDLTVKPISKDSIYKEFCYESSQIAGVFRDTLIAANGCDSIVVFNYVKLPKKELSINKTICKGQNITIGNSIFDTSGTYTEVIKNVGSSKCDSTITLTLNVLDSVVENKIIILCNGESYTHNGIIYNKPIKIREKFSFLNKCDSVFNLDISLIACTLRYQITAKPLSCKSNNDGYFTISALDSIYINYFYAWSALNGTFSLPKLLKGGQSDTIKDLNAGKYLVQIHNGAGLLRFDTIEIIKPKPLFIDSKISDYQGFNTTCANAEDGSIVLTVSGGIQPYTYVWENGYSTSFRERLKAGKYHVTVTDISGCTASFDTSLVSPKAIFAKVSFKNLTCNHSEDGWISIDSVFEGKPPYLYSIDAQAFNSVSKFENLTAAPHLILIKDSKGCIADTTIRLIQPDRIIVNLGKDTTILAGETVKIQGTVNLSDSEIKRILWNDFVTPTCPTCLETVVTPTQNTGYLLTIFDKNNCTGQDYVFVFVNDLPIFTPNSFSPNDDGINDIFTLFGDENAFKINSLQIFNRWGDTVFKGLDLVANDITKGWDGSYKGYPQAAGLFVYVAEIEFKNKTKKVLKGEVFLVR